MECMSFFLLLKLAINNAIAEVVTHSFISSNWKGVQFSLGEHVLTSTLVIAVFNLSKRDF